jgi:hypothetical protein
MIGSGGVTAVFFVPVELKSMNTANNVTKKSLCEQLHAIDRQIKHPRGPTGDSLGRALTFLQKRKSDLYDAFADCAWTYATSPREPQPSFAAAFSRVHHALDHALTLFDGFTFIHHTLRASHTTTRAVDEWTRFHLAVTTGCCGVLPNGETGTRYAIRATPHQQPFGGHLICVPTLTPAKVTERTYNDVRECELALSMLSRGNVIATNGVRCNEYGCYQTPQWSTGAPAPRPAPGRTTRTFGF